MKLMNYKISHSVLANSPKVRKIYYIGF